MKKILLINCLVGSLLFLQQCSRNPVTGKRQVVLMSENQEIAMGQEADPQIIAQFGLYEDSTLQRYFSQKGRQLAAVSHRPKLDYQFRVVDSDVLNAFAVPGGYVYFTRGIMANFNNEAELAGVLGHEIGHIAARHSVAQQRNALLGQLGILAGVVIAPDLARFAETASQGLQLMLLKFSRDDETQADELGVEYSSKTGYDARQMAEFFHTLERQRPEGSEELPDFLSTHPNPGDRNIAVAKLAAEWQQKLQLTNPIISRNDYLRRIDGIVYGEDPRQGYIENNVFYHPVLKFQFNTPIGWAYQNSPQQVQFAPKDGKALLLMTLVPVKTLPEAADAVLQQNNMRAIERREITVNGLPAIAMIADPQPAQGQQQTQALRTLSYLVQYNGNIYLLLGVSELQNFNNYISTFTNTMDHFQVLTDAAKINKKPERIRIRTINQATTLQAALRTNGVPEKRLEEWAIVNGMQLTDPIPAGMMIKVPGQ